MPTALAVGQGVSVDSEATGDGVRVLGGYMLRDHGPVDDDSAEVSTGARLIFDSDIGHHWSAPIGIWNWPRLGSRSVATA